MVQWDRDVLDKGNASAKRKRSAESSTSSEIVIKVEDEETPPLGAFEHVKAQVNAIWRRADRIDAKWRKLKHIDSEIEELDAKRSRLETKRKAILKELSSFDVKQGELIIQLKDLMENIEDCETRQLPSPVDDGNEDGYSYDKITYRKTQQLASPVSPIDDGNDSNEDGYGCEKIKNRETQKLSSPVSDDNDGNKDEDDDDDDDEDEDGNDDSSEAESEAYDSEYASDGSESSQDSSSSLEEAAGIERENLLAQIKNYNQPGFKEITPRKHGESDEYSEPVIRRRRKRARVTRVIRYTR